MDKKKHPDMIVAVIGTHGKTFGACLQAAAGPLARSLRICMSQTPQLMLLVPFYSST
jgi:hypothetical protein